TTSTLFPYTTLFRSEGGVRRIQHLTRHAEGPSRGMWPPATGPFVTGVRLSPPSTSQVDEERDRPVALEHLGGNFEGLSVGCGDVPRDLRDNGDRSPQLQELPLLVGRQTRGDHVIAVLLPRLQPLGRQLPG